MVYLAFVYVVDFALMGTAIVENALRGRGRRAEDFESLAASRFTIPVSVITGVHNEEPVVIATVESLLELDYPEFEVIVVNDASTDRTLELLRERYELEPREVFYRRVLPSRPVVATYRSRIEPKLTVVDKAASGGNKADALNGALNFCRFRYVCAVDGDTIYLADALLKGMRLALKDPARVVAVTSQIAVASLPEKRTGRNGEELIDRTLLSNFQHIEYLRAFLNDRLAWSRLDFMFCMSGAFSIYRRDVLEEIGGFSEEFSCEDLEVTFRVHEHFRRKGERYEVLALPELVAYTEGPATIRGLVAQRERWHRVILETVWHYRNMLGRPRYGAIGVLGVPFLIVSEVIAPIFEAVAIAALAAAVAIGLFEPVEYLLVFGIMSFANALLTSVAILLDDQAMRTYRLRHLVRLLLLSPFELVAYRPVLIWARLKGMWGFFRGDRRWGKFERNIRAEPAA